MGRLTVSRASTAVAVVAAMVAVLAVTAVPGVGIGDPTTTQGGSPSDVFMSTSAENGGVCNTDEVRRRAVTLMPTAITVGEQSHVLVYFTSTLSHYRLSPELVLALQLNGTDVSDASQQWIERGGPARGPHATVTVMWPFADVAPGDYFVSATARIPGLPADGPGANLQSCALTVFVIPAVVPA